ncbi:Kinase [Hexamita inflata]|uniref:non-specific serine/threonine protein kinase n=1 Tax=Hexamita inflata TaxID=28002 RepID=A0AA86R4Z6_9EUKA|nr:Kinase [Hexamita inflata]
MSTRNFDDEYETLKVLGKGYFGTVSLRKQKSTGIVYAVKESNLSACKAEQQKQLFITEAAVMKDLDSTGIVQHIDQYFDEANQKIYIVMGYCDDCNLTQYIQRHRDNKTTATEKQIWHIAHELLTGLDYLHNHARKDEIIVHRDLSSNNVFLSQNGDVRMGDFGFTKVLKRDGSFLKLEAFEYGYAQIVPPHHHPLEILLNQEYNEKADIWSLGTCMFELIALRYTYDQKTLADLIKEIQETGTPKIPSTYSDKLQELIKAMFTFDKSERPGAKELLNMFKEQFEQYK